MRRPAPQLAATARRGASTLLLLLSSATVLHAFVPAGPRWKREGMVAGISNINSGAQRQQRQPVTALAAKKTRSGGGGGGGESSSPEEILNSLISPPPPAPGSVAPPLDGQQPPQPSPLEAAAGEEGEGPGQAERGLSPSMYDKLRAEATTPFRSLRMFIYAGFGAGAGVGGFTAVTQLIKSVQGYEGALPLSQAGLNVGVDFAVLAAAVWAWTFENRLKEQTSIEMMELRAKEPYKLTFDIKAERERALSALPVAFQTGENATLTAPVKQLREKGGQHLVVLAAPKAELADALLGARIAKTLFAKNDVMIVPVVISKDATTGAGAEAAEASAGGGGAAKGFGKGGASGFAGAALLDGENYVAKPADAAGWAAYIEEELSDAVKQGNADARKKGIGVVMRKDGTIIRRGLGQPEWREVVAELTGTKKPGEGDDAYIPLPAVKRNNKRR